MHPLSYATETRLKFSHLNEHKFRHNFKDAPTPMFDCGSETETTDHFFLRCPFLQKIKDTVNKGILVHTIKFLKTTKHFKRPLFVIDICFENMM